ncbi:MAG: hypothetical protein AAB904_01265, partial [Patescibacteria group bacterium]
NIIRGRRYFGAKIIPARGAWIEIETDFDNAIYARIDRKRKIPVSSLLRLFGITTEEKILKRFQGVDTSEAQFIKKTLEKDPAKTPEESYIEVYKRIRPGEPATPEN